MNIPEVHYRIRPVPYYIGGVRWGYRFRAEKKRAFMGIFPWWECLEQNNSYEYVCEFLTEHIKQYKYFDKDGNRLLNLSKIESHEPVIPKT